MLTDFIEIESNDTRIDSNELVGLLSNLSTGNEKIDFAECDIITSNNIYRDILAIDPVYAHERLRNPIYGLLYPTLDNRLRIYIDKTQNDTNRFATLLHEITHYYDYSALAYVWKQPFRALFENDYFLLWTEFHASYVSNRIMIMWGKAKIDCQQVAFELCEKHKKYISENRQIDKEKYANFCVRLFGEIIALSDEFPNRGIIDLASDAINKHFFAVFNYLCNHKTIKEVLSSFYELTELIDAAVEELYICETRDPQQ